MQPNKSLDQWLDSVRDYAASNDMVVGISVTAQMLKKGYVAPGEDLSEFDMPLVNYPPESLLECLKRTYRHQMGNEADSKTLSAKKKADENGGVFDKAVAMNDARRAIMANIVDGSLGVRTRKEAIYIPPAETLAREFAYAFLCSRAEKKGGKPLPEKLTAKVEAMTSGGKTIGEWIDAVLAGSRGEDMRREADEIVAKRNAAKEAAASGEDVDELEGFGDEDEEAEAA